MPTATLQILVVALVHSLLDYGNAVLVGIPTYLVRRLQSVLNAAARLIYHLQPHDHITDALATLYWLHIPECVVAPLYAQPLAAIYNASVREGIIPHM